MAGGYRPILTCASCSTASLSGPDVGVDDHERRGDPIPRRTSSPPRSRRRAGEAGWDHPERHPSKSSWSGNTRPIRRRRAWIVPTSSRSHPRRCRASTHLDPATTFREAGPRPIWNSAYTFADGVEYIRSGRRARHRQVRAPAVVLLGHRDELHGGRQVARWAAAVERAGQGFRRQNPKSLSLRTHSQTSGWSLTAQDAFNNVARRVEAMAATRATPSRCTPMRSTRRWRCPPTLGPHRPQHPVAAGAGVGHHLADRSVGRLVLREWLTTNWRRSARAHIEEVAAHGGMAQAISDGIPKLTIEAAARTQARIDPGSSR